MTHISGDMRIPPVGAWLLAKAVGAASALAVDASAPTLALATKGAEASGVADRFSTRQGDAFEVLEALGAEGARFELVICDPPAFAPAKPALEAGLRGTRYLSDDDRRAGVTVTEPFVGARWERWLRDGQAQGHTAPFERAQQLHAGTAGDPQFEGVARGSLIIADFEDRAAAEAWAAGDPYA